MIETALKHLSSPEWWKHLRPANKRIANRFIRSQDRKIIAEFGDPSPRPTWEREDDGVFVCQNEVCHETYEVPEALQGRAYTVERYWFCPGCRKAWARVVIDKESR